MELKALLQKLANTVAQPAAIDFVSELPASPSDGDRYILDAGEHEDSFAMRVDDEWYIYPPAEGWICVIDGVRHEFDGTEWVTFSAGISEINTEQSVEGDGDQNPVRLVGDEETPGNDHYYGTDNEGNRGYHELPDLSGYITGVAWGDITGTLSEQSDLNTELLDKLSKTANTEFEDDTGDLFGIGENGEPVATPTEELDPAEFGASTYDDLTDTPASKTDKAGYMPAVNEEEDAHEYIEPLPVPELEKDETWVGDGDGVVGKANHYKALKIAMIGL